MKDQKEKRRANLFSLLMFLLVIAVGVSAVQRAKEMQKIDYLEYLDEWAVAIDEKEYAFRDLAFYLAYQEMTTEKQAEVYDLKQPVKYWNIHTNGVFVRAEAKKMAMEMAVHDEIFYQMADKNQIELNQKETEYMENQKLDFWNDLEEEGQTRLGVSFEEISDTFEHMALAQKMPQTLADTEGVDYREYNVDGDMYQELLKEHTFKINESLWKRLNFGKIIVS